MKVKEWVFAGATLWLYVSLANGVYAQSVGMHVDHNELTRPETKARDCGRILKAASTRDVVLLLSNAVDEIIDNDRSPSKADRQLLAQRLGLPIDSYKMNVADFKALVQAKLQEVVSSGAAERGNLLMSLASFPQVQKAVQLALHRGMSAASCSN